MLGLFISVASDVASAAASIPVSQAVSYFKDRVPEDGGYIENYACLESALQALL